MTEPARTPGRGSLVAWGAVGLAALAALSLAGTVFVAWQGTRAAEETVLRGEGEAVFGFVRDELRGGPPDEARLGGLLDRGRRLGLVCVAVRVEPPVAAGAGCEDPTPRPGALLRRGATVIVSAPMPPPRNPVELPRDRMPPLVVLGFVPSVTGELRTAVGRAAWVGGAGAVVLLAAAALLAKAIRDRAREETARAEERRLVALGRMSSVLAHELKNPLAALKGHAQLLVESLPDGTKERTKAERVVHETDRLERLTRDLLDFVREGPIDSREVHVAALVRDACDLVPEAAVATDLAAAPARVAVDGPRIAAALANLIRNAHQAAAGTVELRVTDDGRATTFEVRDRGPGVGDDAERLFEPFFTEKARGTGLGLAVARRAAEQHGGSLRGETHAEGGAVFRLSIPRA